MRLSSPQSDDLRGYRFVSWDLTKTSQMIYVWILIEIDFYDERLHVKVPNMSQALLGMNSCSVLIYVTTPFYSPARWLFCNLNPSILGLSKSFHGIQMSTILSDIIARNRE